MYSVSDSSVVDIGHGVRNVEHGKLGTGFAGANLRGSLPYCPHIGNR